jgi:hypothetical protein
MSYTRRQQHCLKVMGLVAWTSKLNESEVSVCDEPKHGIHANLDSATRKADHSQAADSLQEVLHVPVGVASVRGPDLAAWLENQPLMPFSYRGSPLNVLGSEQASLVVVCMHDAATEQSQASLPLSSECASLFDLMIRAIDLPRTAVRQCVVSRTSALQQTSDWQSFDNLLSPHVRAILVLELLDIWENTSVDSDAATLPGCALPMWRIPHPQILLDNPSLKRRAWESLKCLKKLLVY